MPSFIHLSPNLLPQLQAFPIFLTFPPSLTCLGLYIFTLSAPLSLLRSLISSRLFVRLLFHPRLFFQCAVSQPSDYRAVKVAPKFMSQFSGETGSESAATGICCVEMSVFRRAKPFGTSESPKEPPVGCKCRI